MNLVDRINVKFLEEKPQEVPITDQPFFGTFDFRFNGFELKDTINWTMFSGNYLAKDNEQHMILGCFEPFDSLNFIIFHKSGLGTPIYDAVALVDVFTLIPIPELPSDTAFCIDDTINLIPKCRPGTFYEWNNGQKGAALP